MKIVKISDLSEQEREKALKKQEQRYQRNTTKREVEIQRANKLFNNTIEEKGEYDTSKHTTTIENLRKAYKGKSNYETIKKSTDEYYKKNKKSNILPSAKNDTNNTSNIAQIATINSNNSNKSLSLYGDNIQKDTSGDAKIAKINSNNTKVSLPYVYNDNEQKNNTQNVILPYGNRDIHNIVTSNNVKQADNVIKNANVLEDVPGMFQNLGPGAKNGLNESMNFNTQVNKAYEGYNNITNKLALNKYLSTPITERNKEDLNKNFIEEYLKEDTNKNNEIISNNISRMSNNVTKKIAELAPSVGQMGVGGALGSINPILGTGYFFTSAGGSYYDDAIARGMTHEQALKQASIMGAVEAATEQVGLENFKKAGQGLKTLITGAGKEVTEQALETVAKNEIKSSVKDVLKQYGVGIADNFIQEAIITPIQEVSAYAIGGEDTADFSNLAQRMLQDGIDGALVSAIVGGANLGVNSCTAIIEKSNNGQTITQQEYKQALKDAQEKGINIEQEIKENMQTQINKLNLQQNQLNNTNNSQTQQTIGQENKVDQNPISEQTVGMLNNKKLPMQSYQYEKSDNVKINNLRQDASRYFNNSEKARNYVSMLEKIITDKNIEIRLDGNLKTADGRIANGSYSNGVMTINPNSTRAGEFIAIHELTHAIGTKDMLNMIKTYRNSNAEFDTAVKGLLQNYQSTEITEEALADIAGQLFGNQEFINNIAQKNPNIFQKIYSEIKYLWHQFRGYKNQDQFVEDLYYKWTQAYRNNQKLNNTTNYSIAGRKSLENIRNDINSYNTGINAYNQALNLANQNVDNEKIRQQTGWFQDRNGDWKYEFSDKNMSLKNISFEEGKTYKLGNILNHSDLFALYPQLKNYDVIFEDMKANGSYNNKYKRIKLNIRNSNLEGTLIHEIQHAIQHMEGFEHGTSTKLGKSNYYNNLGEIEASDTKQRFLKEKKGNLDRNIVAPESSKQNAQHSNKNKLSVIEKMKESLYNYFNSKNKGEYEYEEDYQLSEDDRSQDNRLVDGRERISDKAKNSNRGSFSMDNQGRTLSKEQQEFFKDSKVRDENGNLLTVYHGSNSEFTMFDAKKSGQASKESKVGFWFTETKEGAENFANSLWYGDNKAKSYETYLNIKKPKVYNSINNSIELENIDNRIRELKNIIRKLENKNIAIEINKGELRWANENELADIAKYEGIDLEDAKRYHNAVNEYYKLEKDYDNKKYNDSYEKFRSDIYAVAGKSASDANFGGTGMWLENENEIISKFKQKLIDEGYDGIIIRNTKYDSDTMGRNNNQYVAFYPEQIKNVDNTNPTDNPDIRYSQNNQIWQQYLDENYEPTGTRTNLQDIKLPTKQNTTKSSTLGKTIQEAGLPSSKVNSTNRILNPTEIANLKQEQASTTPKLPTKNYERGNKESSFLSNVVTEAGFLNEDLRNEMSKEDNIRYYKGITNAETLEKAYNDLQNGGESETIKWFTKENKNNTAEDVTKGWILLKQYQDNGDYEGAVEVAKKMRNMATNAGQTVQAYNILSRLTPEGMFYYAQSELSEAYSKMAEGKTKQWIEENQSKFDLTPEETQFIKEKMESIQGIEDERTKKIALGEIQKIISDKIPSTKSQSVKAWMRISMLFNSKTQVRNVMGNAVILPVNMTSDFISSKVDKAISKKTGVRTTGNTNLKSYAKGFGKGLYESYDDFRRGINTRNIEGNRFEVNEGKNFKDKGIGKALNRVDNLLSFMLDAGDRGFYEATFTNSINNQLVLNNTTEVTQDMIDIATKEALQRTWQDNNAYTQTVLTIRNALNGKIGKNKGMAYGVGDILIPFAKTPANLTKAIVDYSPIGLTKALTADAMKLKNSLSNGQYTPQLQHKFVQNLGKGMAGTFLYVLGYALAKAGIITGESDEDKDVKNFMKNSLGISSYSIKIGDKTFAYDWAQPIAAPLSIMANIVNSEDKGVALLEGVVGNLDTAGSVLLEQSFLQSISDVLNNSDGAISGLVNEVLELPARAVPTFSKQIADMVDGTQRTTFEYGKPVQSAINLIKAELPFVSRTLPAAVDTLGNEIKKYGGENNLWNVMFNPANTNEGELSKAGEEIYNVYMQTGDTTIFPRTAPYYINYKGEKITMTAEERNEFQKVSGEYVEETLKGLLNNKKYKALSDDKKAKLINEIVSDSYSKAKYDILNIDSEEYEKLRNTLKTVKATSYYDYKFETEGMKKDNEKIEVLIDSNYTDKEKQTIYENYIKTQTKEGSFNEFDVIKASNININEYLKYEQQEFTSDTTDDGTLKGKTISGSKKEKVVEYLNDMKITGNQRLLLYAMQGYGTTSSQKTQLSKYVDSLDLSKEDKLNLYNKFSGFTVYKDGRVTW